MVFMFCLYYFVILERPNACDSCPECCVKIDSLRAIQAKRDSVFLKDSLNYFAPKTPKNP